jgi:hypothetical protein
MSDLRNNFLKYKSFTSHIVEVDVPVPPAEDGTVLPPEKLSVRVKQPSVAERTAIFSEAKVSKAGDVNVSSSARTNLLAIVHCVRDPATDLPVFTVADVDSMMGFPSGSWVDVLAGKVMEVIAEAHEAAKK